jgi:hypothetical protein
MQVSAARRRPLPTPSVRRGDALAALVLFLWVLANYAWTCWFGFVNDDYSWVEAAHRATTAGGGPIGGFKMFWRPVVEWSFALNYVINGAAPAGYHAVNVVLEWVNTYLVWRLANEILGVSPAALVAALLFAAHPSHPGAVTWVCGRTELIGAGLYLGALLLHLHRRTTWAAVLFALALLSKENAVSFPVMVIAVDGILGRGVQWRRCVALYAMVLAAYSLLRTQATSGFAVQYVGVEYLAHGDVPALLRAVAEQVAAAAGALVEPLPVGGIAAVLLLLVMMAGSIAVAADRRTRDAAALASCWIAVALLPFLGWIFFHPRYAYLPSVGLALLLASGGCGLAMRRASQPWVIWVIGLSTAVVLSGDVYAAQRRNEQLRRNAALSARIVGAVAQVVPNPVPGTLFVIDGIGALRLGRDPFVRTPVLVYGLGDALRLRYGDASLDAGFPDQPVPPPGTRPLVRLKWNAQTGTMQR